MLLGLVACSGAPADGAARAADEPLALRVAAGRPLATVSEAERGRFLLGRAVFERVATEAEGLGPLFNAARCSDCHDQPSIGGSGAIMVTKAARWDGSSCDPLRATGGDNIQSRSTSALAAHGIAGEEIPPEATHSGLARPTQLYGLGLLEAVSEANLVDSADPDDADGDGVSGRTGRDAQGRVGRFGWKADQASVADFVDGALRFELGFTTPEVPHEESPNGQPLPEGVDPMPEPEIDAEGVQLLVEYIQLLGPPLAGESAGEATDAAAAEGAQRFAELGCAACHTPSLTTASPVGGLPAGTQIAAYTDLLLHDMGPELVGVCGGSAQPSEYRTPPLWGVSMRPLLLHDGRATTLEAAIEAHAGEASAARDAYLELSAPDRAALLEFLRTL